ncbi:MAG TPA: class I SAM-dependent methyltransferase [Planctomycetaceae bacterium]|nr:class I SAM-dependent methyltransferase [Planctomycetaceae bacterium]
MPDPSRYEDFDLLVRLRQAGPLFDLLREARGPELHVQRRLRRDFPEDLVRAAVALEELRRKAAGKFSRAESMWLDRQGLEQATAEAVSRHKALRFGAAPVRDLCCGIGGDALALAERCRVVAVDRDPAACLRTTWNAEVYGVRERVSAVCADARSIGMRGALVHIDPDRRAGGQRRSVRLEDAEPGLDFLTQLIDDARGGAIKLSPAANFGGRFPQAEIELVSLDGECKEATVWFGELGEPGLWRATVLPAGETIAGDPLSAAAEVVGPGQFVYDPDPAIVRAGLVDLLAVDLGLERLDESEEYLTSDALVASPFVRPFEILAELANNPREIRQSVREHGFGQIEIKARHIPIDAEAIRRRLPLEGREPGVLILARLRGKARVLLCRRAGSPA